MVTSETTVVPQLKIGGGDADPVLLAALAILVIATATIGGAWFFQLVLDIKPCPLCLEQRYAYYTIIPLSALIALLAWRGGFLPDRFVLIGIGCGYGLSSITTFQIGRAHV